MFAERFALRDVGDELGQAAVRITAVHALAVAVGAAADDRSFFDADVVLREVRDGALNGAGPFEAQISLFPGATGTRAPARICSTDFWPGSSQRDRPSHDNVAREARYHDRRCRLERLVAAQLAEFKLLSHTQLDLALRAHTKLLEELPHRHVEGVFVHSSLLDSLI
jgi:hypothetical protein